MAGYISTWELSSLAEKEISAEDFLKFCVFELLKMSCIFKRNNWHHEVPAL